MVSVCFLAVPQVLSALLRRGPSFSKMVWVSYSVCSKYSVRANFLTAWSWTDFQNKAIRIANKGIQPSGPLAPPPSLRDLSIGYAVWVANLNEQKTMRNALFHIKRIKNKHLSRDAFTYISTIICTISMANIILIIFHLIIILMITTWWVIMYFIIDYKCTIF